MLGHDLHFSYCRQPGRDLPCSRIGDCWYETFDVEKFIRAVFTEDEVKQILAPPKPKMTSLIELIQQAKKAAEKDEK